MVFCLFWVSFKGLPDSKVTSINHGNPTNHGVWYVLSYLWLLEVAEPIYKRGWIRS
jgi:hypothetical protein